MRKPGWLGSKRLWRAGWTTSWSIHGAGAPSRVVGGAEAFGVSETYVADAALVRLVPHSLAALRIAAVSDREVSRALIALIADGIG